LSAALFAQTTTEVRPSGGLAAQNPSAEIPGAITCILPVYNAFDLLPEVLDRLCRHTDLPWHALIIEDCSTDPAVRPFLRTWAAAQNALQAGSVTLLENAQNLGFLGSVNRGLALALPRGAPVVLLNADALLPAGWARRLIAPLRHDPRVASCTPLSNEAELFSVPVICARQDLAAGQADLIDAAAQRFVPGAGDAIAPTGVGFCMALHPDWLARVPLFDTAFAPGYGEEVDWCQQTRAFGARHVGVANLFVEHRGGASFGSAQKQRLIAAHSGLISARYPQYDIDVQDYLRTDPMLTPRLALALVWAGLQAEAAGDLLPIYLTHTMRGGVEYHQKQSIAADIARLGAAAVLRVGGAARWRMELHTLSGVTQGETDDFTLIQHLLQPLARRRLVYVCGVGDSDPVTLPDHLLALCRDGDALEVQFHDYFALSPSFNLLNETGQFDGVPAADNRDPAHQSRRPDGSSVPLAQWRAAWGRLMTRADRLVVFSQDSRQHVVRAWPDLDGRLVVQPHQLHHSVPQVIPRAGSRPVVAVLGNLNRPKGAALLAALGATLVANRQRGDVQLLVLGDIDPSEPRHPAIAVLGEYKLAGYR
jgi:GT2 family glycosyltransferase